MRALWPRVPHRHLIGPTFFPVYLLVLKVALAVTVVVTAGFAILGPTGDAESRPRLVEVLSFLIRRSLIAFGLTTLAFAAVDLSQSRFLRQRDWDPRLLPAVVRLEIACTGSTRWFSWCSCLPGSCGCCSCPSFRS